MNEMIKNKSTLSKKGKVKFKKLLQSWEGPFRDKGFPFMEGIKYDVNLNFREDLGLDSLDEIELLMEFEKQFCCGISDSIAIKIKTIADAQRIIANSIFQAQQKSPNLN
tara:strand:- start:784 stop:1110 length:327 start_codon:yes stop_codon:yes gene_type:complete